jgi:hypothetical protein
VRAAMPRTSILYWHFSRIGCWMQRLVMIICF